jgi:TonB family protein
MKRTMTIAGIALVAVLAGIAGVASASSTGMGSGNLDKDIIRRVIRYNQPAVKACYDDALASDSTQAGDLVVDFVIAPDGHVDGASVSEASGNLSSGLEKCVVGVVVGARFPAPEGGGTVHVSYPFAFASSSP